MAARKRLKMLVAAAGDKHSFMNRQDFRCLVTVLDMVAVGGASRKEYPLAVLTVDEGKQGQICPPRSLAILEASPACALVLLYS